jgi:2-dehydro-3-deoxyphosphooctonate aldolase (KDO 8-P synthase)
LSEVCARLSLPLIFKASFDKANRSSHTSYRGPGLERGLAQLADLKARFGFPLITDIHAPEQAAPVAEVVDCLQIPAFLVRQTDLIEAACRTGKPLHLKKMQCMAPLELQASLKKCEAFGQPNVILCERGTLFGYNNLVVDPLSFSALKGLGAPVSFDVTHALQQPGALGHATGGRGHLTAPLMAAGVSQGIAALFLELHPEPNEARCDGPCALRLDEAEALLRRARSLDEWAKEGT